MSFKSNFVVFVSVLTLLTSLTASVFAGTTDYRIYDAAATVRLKSFQRVIKVKVGNKVFNEKKKAGYAVGPKKIKEAIVDAKLLSKTLGAKYKYLKGKKKVIISKKVSTFGAKKKMMTVTFKIGKKSYLLNGKSKSGNVSARIINGRPYVSAINMAVNVGYNSVVYTPLGNVLFIGKTSFIDSGEPTPTPTSIPSPTPTPDLTLGPVATVPKLPMPTMAKL